MTKLAPQEKAVTEWLASQKEAMLALLAEVVNIDSGSYDKAGVDAVGERFIRFFEEQGLLTTREPNERFGDAIHIRLDDKPSNERPIVLMGHRDTVFPKGEVARRPFRIENGRAYGPGVVDMKSGLVLNAFVLAAFKRFGGAPAPLAGLITSDEEIASPSSRPVIERVGPGGALRFQLRARPTQRQHRDGAQGRRVPGLRDHRQGRPLRRQLREGHQRHRRDGAQDRRHAQADRPEAAASPSTSGSSRAASPSTPRRPRRGADRPALREARAAQRRRSPPCRRSSTAPPCRAPPRSSRSRASSCRSRARRPRPRRCSAPIRRRRRMPA